MSTDTVSTDAYEIRTIGSQPSRCQPWAASMLPFAELTLRIKLNLVFIGDVHYRTKVGCHVHSLALRCSLQAINSERRAPIGCSEHVCRRREASGGRCGANK